jgi:hypothetical protein
MTLPHTSLTVGQSGAQIDVCVPQRRRQGQHTGREWYEKAAAAGDPEVKADLGIGGAKSEKAINGDGSLRAATAP